jgi:hypothetical protein
MGKAYRRDVVDPFAGEQDCAQASSQHQTSAHHEECFDVKVLNKKRDRSVCGC